MINDAENWESLQSLFHLVEMTPEKDRQRVLSEQCPDEALRHRVIEILRASSVESSTISKERPIQGGRIGLYTLIRHLGSGGLGSVYLVERMVGGIVQRAALKVLAAHAAGASFIERFYREEDILASLNHPNITHMFDAGLTETGQPYLVMEYVDGLHLDAYCDRKKLSIFQRIQLFLQVCNAVGYAHRNLVIHLDLKPSNILVTAEAEVKLLDFGTSKIIQSDSLLTTTVLATPAYASPEQLRNEPLTTSSDIYSLGAILFELLSGRRHGGKASVAIMIERALRDQPPEKLTHTITPEAAELRGVSENRLRQLLTGDLSTIIAKCLSLHAEERYPSTDMLVEDLRLYLDGRPVLARPQTTLYRFGKFVRRNRKSVAVTAAAFAVVIGVASYAEVQQERALREGQRALRMQTFMYRMFKMANSPYTGKPTATVSDLLKLGVKMLPQYIKDPTDLREAQMSLAESMLENDDFDSARKVFMETIASAKSAGDINAEAESEAFAGEIAYIQGDVNTGAVLTAHALALSAQRSVTPSVRVWSEMYYATNRDDADVGQRSDENLRLLRSAVAEAEAQNLPSRETADAIYTLADDLKGRGQISEAEPLFKKLLVLLLQDPLSVCDQASVYLELAWIRDFDGNLNGSLEFYKQALGDYSQCSGTESQGYLLAQADQLGELTKAGRAQEGIDGMERSMPARRKLLKNGGQLWGALYVLANAYIDLQRYKDAETVANELDVRQAGRVAAPSRPTGLAHLVWARALLGERRYQEALPHAELAATLLNYDPTPSAKTNEALANKVLADIKVKLAAR